MAGIHGDARPSALDLKIIRQIEYYFGDINLPRDRFLQEKVRENEGWVSLDVMLNFNRLKELSQDKQAICSALQKSSSGLIEVSADSHRIRRSPAQPLPDNTKERKDDLLARTYYVKPFPLDVNLDMLTEFFENFGKIESVHMRRAGKPERQFKGSVFVVFADKINGDKFLAMENIRYQSTDLIKMSKEGYFKMKAEQVKQQKHEEVQVLKSKQTEEEPEKKLEDQITKGSILFIKGLSEDTTREDIKSFFGDYGSVAWVEFNKGEDKALLRIHDGQAKEVMEKSKEAGDGKIILDNSELDARVLEGEEELDYWRKMFREVAERKNQKKLHHSQNRKRKFGNRPSKQAKRKIGVSGQGKMEEEPVVKAAKVE